MHVRQTEISAGVAIGQSFVIEAHQMQNRGMDVMHVDRVLDGTEAEFVGGPMDVAPTYAAARHPHRKAIVVVVAAVDACPRCRLLRAVPRSACGRTRRPR